MSERSKHQPASRNVHCVLLVLALAASMVVGPGAAEDDTLREAYLEAQDARGNVVSTVEEYVPISEYLPPLPHQSGPDSPRLTVDLTVDIDNETANPAGINDGCTQAVEWPRDAWAMTGTGQVGRTDAAHPDSLDPGDYSRIPLLDTETLNIEPAGLFVDGWRTVLTLYTGASCADRTFVGEHDISVLWRGDPPRPIEAEEDGWVFLNIWVDVPPEYEQGDPARWQAYQVNNTILPNDAGTHADVGNDREVAHPLPGNRWLEDYTLSLQGALGRSGDDQDWYKIQLNNFHNSVRVTPNSCLLNPDFDLVVRKVSNGQRVGRSTDDGCGVEEVTWTLEDTLSLNELPDNLVTAVYIHVKHVDDSGPGSYTLEIISESGESDDGDPSGGEESDPGPDPGPGRGIT